MAQNKSQVNVSPVSAAAKSIVFLRPGRYASKTVVPHSQEFGIFSDQPCVLDAACACVIPYISIYNRYLGLSASQNGIIFGGLPFVAMLSKPLTGALADRSSFRPANLSRFFIVIQTIVLFAVYFVPRSELASFPAPSTCSISSCQTLLSQITATGNFSCNVKRGEVNWTVEYAHFVDLEQLKTLVDADGRNASCCCEKPQWEPNGTSQSGLYWTTQFWLTAVLLVVGFSAAGAVTTLIDTIAFALVEMSPFPTSYGSNRVFG
ncbi:hypothetical protein RvY_02251 [Ramazzottius varieornatus]|uniref:Major facilitator superfamily associated domain-containing protein n=1 Tax=Ramazzottius varieornatus TaxID=947166 RepID=A0A1D1UJ43_RAMVA|nr:hypothetical protein RvY_02251 [Ramazzottius varieornatus]